MRIAIDVDSTLHDYWPLLRAAAVRRYGVDLPYAEQRTWEVPQLTPEQLTTVIADTHAERAILDAVPYPGAVEAVRGWHEAGHWIHVTTHRDPRTHDATARWLRERGFVYDDLHCSSDKIVRCVELGIDLLVDDSPVNLARAARRGIAGATVRHPWNAEACAAGDVVCAEDWAGLRRALLPVLAGEDA